MNENIKFFDFLYYFLFGILISFIKIKENKNKLKKLIFFVCFYLFYFDKAISCLLLVSQLIRVMC
jgi:hypothetical protein